MLAQLWKSMLGQCHFVYWTNITSLLPGSKPMPINTLFSTLFYWTNCTWPANQFNRTSIEINMIHRSSSSLLHLYLSCICISWHFKYLTSSVRQLVSPAFKPKQLDSQKKVSQKHAEMWTRLAREHVSTVFWSHLRWLWAQKTQLRFCTTLITAFLFA